MFRRKLYLGFGTNLGDRRKNLSIALHNISERLGTVPEAVSDVIETEPWGFESGNDFLNLVARYSIPDVPAYSAKNVLALCKEVEKEMGRDDEPETDKFGHRIYRSRVIDIDIILFGTERIENEILTVPHKHIAERDFVMIPLRQVAEDDVQSEFAGIFKSND